MFYLVPEKDVILGITLVGKQPERWEDVDYKRRWADSSIVWYKGKIGSMLVKNGDSAYLGRMAAYSMECLNDKKLLEVADKYLDLAYKTQYWGLQNYQNFPLLQGEAKVQSIDEADLTLITPDRKSVGKTSYDLLLMDKELGYRLSPEDKKFFEEYLK